MKTKKNTKIIKAAQITNHNTNKNGLVKTAKTYAKQKSEPKVTAVRNYS